MTPGMLTPEEVAAIEKRLFYVVHADGTSEVAIAESEDDIVGAQLVISFEEVEAIQSKLVFTRDAIRDAPTVAVPIQRG